VRRRRVVRTVISLSLAVALLAVAAVAVRYATRDTAQSASDATGATGDLVTVTITAHDLRFDPAELDFTVGTPVRLTFVNAGTVAHDVSIPGINATGEVLKAIQPDSSIGQQDAHGGSHGADTMPPGTIHLAAEPGESVSLEFIPTSGTFNVLCTVAGHREAGMVGSAFVE
jgi:plastocyanin